MYLNLYYYNFKDDIENFRAYIEAIKEPLNERQEHTRDAYNKFVEMSPEDVDGRFEVESFQHFKIFPHLAYSSIFISMIAFLEKSLKDVCTYTEFESSIQWNDLAGNGLEKCRKYLLKVKKINLDEVNDLWNEVTKLIKIRNKIVHEGCNIWEDRTRELDKQELFETISKNASFKLDGLYGDFLLISDDFLKISLTIISEFMFAVYAKLQGKEDGK